eukprot:COSAG01_NODE_25595_length_740_cov_0.847114_2_plen_131_part_00
MLLCALGARRVTSTALRRGRGGWHQARRWSTAVWWQLVLRCATGCYSAKDVVLLLCYCNVMSGAELRLLVPSSSSDTTEQRRQQQQQALLLLLPLTIVVMMMIRCCGCACPHYRCWNQREQRPDSSCHGR